VVDLLGLAAFLRREGYSGSLKLVPFCLDETGTKHFGKKWKFDVSKNYKDNYYYDTPEGQRSLRGLR
jgi:hypothetical protein